MKNNLEIKNIVRINAETLVERQKEMEVKSASDSIWDASENNEGGACLCRSRSSRLLSHDENLCGCNRRPSAISRKDNHHDHTARHSVAAQTACTMSFVHSANNMQVCTGALCRAVWSW